jgi:predicted  nucleic acid-binding Zn-ribbon protein
LIARSIGSVNDLTKGVNDLTESDRKGYLSFNQAPRAIANSIISKNEPWLEEPISSQRQTESKFAISLTGANSANYTQCFPGFTCTFTRRLTQTGRIMTFLGRTFILVILILSIAFCFLAALTTSSHVEKKSKIATFKTQVKQLETTIDELKKLIEQTKTAQAQEQGSRASALASLQTQLEGSKAELAQSTTALNDKSAALTEQTQRLGETIERVKLLTSLNDSLKTEIDKVITDRNDQRRRVITLTDKYNGLVSVEADLKAEVSKLQESSTYYQAKSETAESALKVAGITDLQDVPPSDLKGEVLSVNSDKLVVISVGRDDGLREGHRLEVYRSGQYLGRIQIRTVKDDQAVGQILTSFRKGYIQAGDKVAAKVN